VSDHRPDQPVGTEDRLTPVLHGYSARSFSKLLAIALAAVFFVACRRAQVSPPCPPDAELMGAAPPKGFEVWCQKTINGKPVKDGPFIVYAVGGDRMIQGSYRNGVQDGEWTLWYENGVRASIDHYVDGLQSGMHTSWYANGQKALEGEYLRGKREGVWTQWDAGGLSSRKSVYKAGRIK
jgi:MORN repeat protein